MRNTGYKPDWSDAEHLNRTDSLPSAREAYLKSLTDNLTKKNIIRLAFMAGFMTSAAIFLYYFITQLGLRDEKLGSDAPRWLTLIANGTGNNVSDLPPPSGIPPTLPLHIPFAIEDAIFAAIK